MPYSGLTSDLIELHRENATLQAQLASAQEEKKRLQAVNEYLLNKLASSSTRVSHGNDSAPHPPVQGYSTASHDWAERRGTEQFEKGLVLPREAREFHEEGYPRLGGIREHSNRQGFYGSERTNDFRSKLNVDAAEVHRTLMREIDDDVDETSRDEDLDESPVLDPTAPRFVPPPWSYEFHRAVVISDIPTVTKPSHVAANVFGGLLVSLKLLDTTTITKSKTAIVVFFEEKSAALFVKSAINNPIKLCGQDVKVNRVRTPCPPLPRRTLCNIVGYGATRCVVIKWFPRHLLLGHLCRKLNPHEHIDMHGIVNLYQDSEGLVHVDFDSVDRASSARARINAYDAFRPAVAEFAPDPCNIPTRKRELTEETPKGPRAMRAQPYSVSKRGYYDIDAPRASVPKGALDYGEETPRPEKQTVFRRPQPLDYSDLGDNHEINIPALTPTSKSEPKAETQDDPEDARRPPSRTSSLESGEIVESQGTSKSGSHVSKLSDPTCAEGDHTVERLEALTLEEDPATPKHDEGPHRPNEFRPIVNRYIGPPRLPPGADLHAEESDGDSDADSVESERAKARRHADEMLAEMQEQRGTQILDY